ncbi:hypothetical protein ACH5RR_008666 [Cinchona calisaya]|uniref:Uncharacterized protein n=1 Tax=Cinchona calisaya TaxID=153742 RepID=A0ABD3ACD1_9GENT
MMAQTQRTRNLSSSGALAVEGSVACGSASEETNPLCSHPSPSSVLDVPISAPMAKGIVNSVDGSNPTRTVDVEPPLSGSVGNEFNPQPDDEMLYSTNTGRQAIPELGDDSQREQAMVSSTGEPFSYSNAIKKMEGCQQFLNNQSVCRESIVRTKDQLINGNDAVGPEASISLANSPISPSISALLNFEETLQCGNDLKQLGFEDNFTYGNRSNELFDCLNEDVAMDSPELDEEELKWLNENLLNDDLISPKYF